MVSFRPDPCPIQVPLAGEEFGLGVGVPMPPPPPPEADGRVCAREARLALAEVQGRAGTISVTIPRRF